MKNGNKLYADLIGFESTSSLFESSRPDACIVTANGEVLPLELTVCHELNFEKARDYKEERYRDLRKDLKINCTKFEISFIEISALEFVPTSIKEFKKACKSFGIAFDKLLAKCSGVAIRIAYEQSLGRIEGRRKEESLYAHLKFYCSATFNAKYLAHNLGSATEMIINITLVDDFMTFNILN